MDKNGDVSWIDPDGALGKKKAKNRKIGYRRHGHTIAPNANGEYNFEDEFAVDGKIHHVIKQLEDLKPFGSKLVDVFRLVRYIFKQPRNFMDICSSYSLDYTLRKDAVLLVHSIIMRSPQTTSSMCEYPELFGLPTSEDVGKINLLQNYSSFRKSLSPSKLSNVHILLIHSASGRFVFGDGCFQSLSSVYGGQMILGRAILALTPNLCVYLCAPLTILSSSNCTSICAPAQMISEINELTQIYSKNRIFFRGKIPKTTPEFQSAEFGVLEGGRNSLIDLLDAISGAREFDDRIVIL